MNTEKSKRLGSKTLYFVDSCTERQLDGGHRRHGSTGSAGSGKPDGELREPDFSLNSPQDNKIVEQVKEVPSKQNQNRVYESNSNHRLPAPKPTRIYSFSPQVPISPRDDYSLGENSQLLPDETLNTEYGLEIRSEPNRSPLLIRDSDTNSDGDSVRSSTEPRNNLNKDIYRANQSRRAGSLRTKLTSSLSQQITRQRTLMHAKGMDIPLTEHGIGHHRSTSDPTLFSNQQSIGEADSIALPPPIQHSKILPRRSFQGYISPADSLDPHGYALASRSQSSRGFGYADTIDSNDLILSPDISVNSGVDSLPPFMKKSLSLDYGLNNYNDNGSLADSANEIMTPSLHSLTSQSLVNDGQHERGSPSKRRIDSLNRKGSLGINSKSLSETAWSILRQQVFLGMTASSVPIRQVVSNTYSLK